MNQQNSLPQPDLEYSPQRRAHTSSLLAKNVYIADMRTSIRLEQEMWAAITQVSEIERISTGQLMTLIATRKQPAATFTSAVRVFLLLYFQAKAGVVKESPLKS